MALSQKDLQAIAILMDSKLDPIKTEIVELKEGITGLKTEIAGMQTEITGLKTEITGLKTEITGIKTEIAGMQTEITGIKTEITGLKKEIVGIKVELSQKADKKDIEYLKNQIRKSERLLLDEVERVHEILDMHIKDTTRHTA
ncbi:hypothetical protein [Diplocloster agilis]|uniref:hypothetical protein n=1 Tax=Diplocloster agilis TaxID=2850323 RepID=UPI001EE81B01|nr:hypothetical protein [Diplocloster agilis]